MEKIKYYFNEDKKIVVAKMDKDAVKEALSNFYIKLGKGSEYNGLIVDETIIDNLVTPIVAKAICSENDIYDAHIGKIIAHEKLNIKLNSKKEKLVESLQGVYMSELMRLRIEFFKANKKHKEAKLAFKEMIEDIYK